MVNLLQNEFYQAVKLRFPIESDEIVLEIERKSMRLKNIFKARREKKRKSLNIVKITDVLNMGKELEKIVAKLES